MGSTGTGNFSDYKKFPRAIKGVTGADDSEETSALLRFQLLLKMLILVSITVKREHSQLLVLKSILISRSDW